MLNTIQKNIDLCKLQNSSNSGCYEPANWTIALPGEWRTSNCSDALCIDTKDWNYGTDDGIYANRIIGNDRSEYVYYLELNTDGKIRCYNNDEVTSKDYCKMIGTVHRGELN